MKKKLGRPVKNDFDMAAIERVYNITLSLTKTAKELGYKRTSMIREIRKHDIKLVKRKV